MCYVLPETARSIVDLTRSGLPDVKTPGKVVDRMIRGEEWSHAKIHAYTKHYGVFPHGMGSLDPRELAKNKPWPPLPVLHRRRKMKDARRK